MTAQGPKPLADGIMEGAKKKRKPPMENRLWRVAPSLP
jgi:hypothetical protein